MKKMIFEVQFISDVILQATSNSEGKVEDLDFIPGSVFLGIVANQAYDKVSDSFKVFHSGMVRFGDATPICNNQETFKMPFSFFHEKLDDSKLYNHHKIEDFSVFKQLKQKRNGYITKDLEEFYVDYNYSQKSAYDKKARRSKEGSMYGYNAIVAGTNWRFAVNYDESLQSDADEIKKMLIGTKRIGKSKSAQYGEIEITYKDEIVDTRESPVTDETVVYAKSRLALFDHEGQPSYDVKYLLDGLAENQVVYDKCQLRISSFTPFNFKRERKDYERVVINAGSVIVLKDLTQEQITQLKNGVGAYLSEGFGEVLINPDFLQPYEFSFKKTADQETKTDQMKKIEQNFKDSTVQFLVNRHNQLLDDLSVAKEVQEFINKNQNLFTQKMNSQWGTIRSLCSMQDNRSIKTRVNDYISNGVAKEKWSGEKSKKLLEAIEKSSDALAFTKLLSIQMPKYNQGGSDDK